MDARIESVDTEKGTSRGQRLAVRCARIEAVVRRHEILPLGESKERYYVELSATSWDGATKSVLTAQLDWDDLQCLCNAALSAGLVGTLGK
jgi:hypothetical protein